MSYTNSNSVASKSFSFPCFLLLFSSKWETFSGNCICVHLFTPWFNPTLLQSKVSMQTISILTSLKTSALFCHIFSFYCLKLAILLKLGRNLCKSILQFWWFIDKHQQQLLSTSFEEWITFEHIPSKSLICKLNENQKCFLCTDLDAFHLVAINVRPSCF